VAKKISLILGLVAFISIPSIIYAQDFTVPNPVGVGNLEGIINIILQVAFGVAGLVAVIYLIIGGYRYITSSGNPEAVEGAKSTIINSIIGLIIILAAVLIINYIFRALNIADPFRFNVNTTTISPTPAEENSLPEPTTTTTSTPRTNNTPTPYPNQSPALYV